MTDISDLKNYLDEIKHVKDGELNNHLYHFPIQKFDNITCLFYLVNCTANKIREEDFIEFLISKIIRYVLPKSEYESVENNSPDRYMDIVRKAKQAFSELTKSGESGELILFVMLEAQGIVQLIQKMKLKTSKQILFQGMDAIHFGVNEVNEIVMHFGAAKMYKNLSSAIDDAMTELGDYEDEKSKQNIDIDLVTRHIDTLRFGKYVSLIKDMLNPYSENKEYAREQFSVLVSYDWATLKANNERKSGLGQFLKNKYSEQHTLMLQKIKTKVCHSKIHDREFQFYLLPFRDF